MNILDYGCGGREHVLDFWRENYGITALRKYVQREVGEITIHALDALEIRGHSSEEHDGVRYEFYNFYPDLPTGLDVICALHPNPGVILDRHGYPSTDEDFETSRYLGFLSNVIAEKAKNGAIVALQFDDELQKGMYGEGGSEFITKLQKYGTYQDYCLEPRKPLNPEPKFPSWIYKFSSFHLFEKQSLEI